MINMSFVADDTIQNFIDSEIEHEGFQTASEVMRDAFRQAMHSRYEKKLSALRILLEEGLQSGRAKNSSIEYVVGEIDKAVA